MRHADLVARAEGWLYSIGCGIVFTELVTRSYEIPDAIGFRSWCSILVEAKATRGDFLSDAKKPHRTEGMGDWRFFMCPPGLIQPEEVPEGWGLLYADKRIRRIVGGPKSNHWDVPPRTGNKRDEMVMTYSALRRLKLRGRLLEIYEPAPDETTAASAPSPATNATTLSEGDPPLQPSGDAQKAVDVLEDKDK